MNPWGSLLRSRKFWVMLMDLVLSMTIYFVGKYAAPVLAEDVKFIVASIQPVFLFLIGAIAYEDKAAIENGYNAVSRTYSPTVGPYQDLTESRS
jgi:hypothetical protein